jgi:uncharacterized protein (DUF302 family)
MFLVFKLMHEMALSVVIPAKAGPHGKLQRTPRVVVGGGFRRDDEKIWKLLRAVGILLLFGTMPAAAQEIVTRVKTGDYDDVRMDLNTAVLATGVSIQSQGNVAAMLGKTAADLGATQTVYAHAEFIAMCSARYSRALMEADPLNMAFCPFTVFIYETKAKPGEIVIGYRPLVLPSGASAAAKAAAVDVNALLGRIVEQAVK